MFGTKTFGGGRLAAMVFTLAAIFALGTAFGGCGKPTVEGKQAQYKRVKDRLDALSTKMPQLKAGITKKIAEFEAEYKTASGKSGEEAVAALGALVRRMEAYETEINPEKKAAGAAGTAPAGSKLGPGATKPAPAAGQPAQPSKLGGGAAPAKPVGGNTGSGFTGKTGNTAPAKTAPAPAPANNNSGSGFGGK